MFFHNIDHKTLSTIMVKKHSKRNSRGGRGRKKKVYGPMVEPRAHRARKKVLHQKKARRNMVARLRRAECKVLREGRGAKVKGLSNSQLSDKHDAFRKSASRYNKKGRK